MHWKFFKQESILVNVQREDCLSASHWSDKLLHVVFRFLLASVWKKKLEKKNSEKSRLLYIYKWTGDQIKDTARNEKTNLVFNNLVICGLAEFQVGPNTH